MYGENGMAVLIWDIVHEGFVEMIYKFRLAVALLSRSCVTC